MVNTDGLRVGRNFLVNITVDKMSKKDLVR